MNCNEEDQDAYQRTNAHHHCPSLDFERIVNSYSIEHTKARMINDGKRKHIISHNRHSKNRDYKRRSSENFSNHERFSSFDVDSPFLSVHPPKVENGENTQDEDSSSFADGNDLCESKPLLESMTAEKGNKNHMTYTSVPDGQNKKQLVLKDSSEAAVRRVFSCATGLGTGLVTVFIIYCIDTIVSYRERQLSYRVSILGQEFSTVFVLWSSLNLVLALSSAAMCTFISPSAAGSGIPEVKAYLNGVRVEKFNDFNLFLVKIIGTILSVSSGLAIGPEGPLVHIGAILGSSLTKTGWIDVRMRNFRRNRPTLSGMLGCASHTAHLKGVLANEKKRKDWSFKKEKGGVEEYTDHCTIHEDYGSKKGCWKSSLISSLMEYMSHFRNDAERRDFISIGSAAGFAAAFGAPVGGVLYSLEETSSFFANCLLWQTLMATAIATFCIAVYHGNLSRFSVLTLHMGEAGDETVILRFGEVPIYIVFGFVGGLLGAIFNGMCSYLSVKRKHFFRGKGVDTRKMFQLLEVIFLSLFTSTILFWFSLQAHWACKVFDDPDKRNKSQYNCDVGSINEVGQILFGSRDEAILRILEDPLSFDSRTLVSIGIIFFCLMIITNGTALPSGIFMPTILVGACFGGATGIWLKKIISDSFNPSVFALLGAAALLAGIQRTTVSLCVILMEGTGQTKVLIPVIVTIVVATYIGNLFNHGIYEILIELKGYSFLAHKVRKSYDMFRVRDIMTTNLVILNSVETAGDIEHHLWETSHHGFPVVDSKTGNFLGLVRRDQLCAMLECGIFMKESSSQNHGGNSLAEGHSDVELNESDALLRISLLGSSFFRHRYSPSTRGDAMLSSFNYLPKDLADSSRMTYDSHLMRMALHIRDDRYESSRSGKEERNCCSYCWNKCSKLNAMDTMDPMEDHAWFSDNVLVDGEGAIVSDVEDLPWHRSNPFLLDGGQTVVSTSDGKLVVSVSCKDRLKHINVGAVTNLGAFTVTEGMPLSKVYEVFTKLGLRHLCVLGSNGNVVGIVTRSNLSKEVLEEKTGYIL